MRLVRADFRRRAVPPRGLWWALALLGIASAASAITALREWQRIKAQAEVLRQTVATNAAAPAPEKPARAPTPYDTSARAMVTEATSPWPQALTMVEATGIVGVTPVAIEFVATERSVRVEVSFTDYAKLLEYVEALNAGEPDFKWSLLQSQAQPGGAATAVVVGGPVRR
jgi:hypothetical protein